MGFFKWLINKILNRRSRDQEEKQVDVVKHGVQFPEQRSSASCSYNSSQYKQHSYTAVIEEQKR